MAQKHPAQNGGVGVWTRNRWFLDDVTGMYHRESDMVRDYNERLRFVNDIDDADADELRAHFEFPTEQDYPDP